MLDRVVRTGGSCLEKACPSRFRGTTRRRFADRRCPPRWGVPRARGRPGGIGRTRGAWNSDGQRSGHDRHQGRCRMWSRLCSGPSPEAGPQAPARQLSGRRATRYGPAGTRCRPGRLRTYRPVVLRQRGTEAASGSAFRRLREARHERIPGAGHGGGWFAPSSIQLSFPGSRHASLVQVGVQAPPSLRCAIPPEGAR